MAISGDWTKLAVLLLTLLVGGGAKVASLDALFRIRDIERVESALARVEADALRLALAVRMEEGGRDAAALAQSLAERMTRLDIEDLAEIFAGNPAVEMTVTQLEGIAAPERLRALAPALERAGADITEQVDSVALMAAAAADSVHAASAVRVEGLWARVLVLGGGAIVAFVLTSLGGSTWGALASRRVQGALSRVEEFAKKLRQADADKKRAVEAAELAAIQRGEARAAEAMNTLREALALAEAGSGANEEARAEAEASLSLTREMLATLNDHIQAPLEGIREMAKTMTVGSMVTEADRRRIELIELSGDALDHLAQTALDLVRLDRGEEGLREHPFRPELMLERIIDATRDTAQRHGISVRLAYADGTAASRTGDEGRVGHLVETLLRDAIAVTPRGEVLLELEDARGGVRISVVDGGPRPTAEEAKKAFGPEGTAARPARSVALAMARVLKAVMTAEPGAKRGTAVHITLPLADDEIHRRPASLEPAEG